jgi:hypothetical protein
LFSPSHSPSRSPSPSRLLYFYTIYSLEKKIRNLEMSLIVGSGRIRVWAYTGTRIRFFFIPDARPNPTNRTRTYAPGRVGSGPGTQPGCRTPLVSIGCMIESPCFGIWSVMDIFWIL